MENISELNQDRREFFRVTDLVFIDFAVIDAVEQQRLTPIIQNSGHSEETNVRQRLNTIQSTLHHLIDQVNQNDREIARALRLLDEKVSLIAQTVHQQQNMMDNREAIDANLSGGGISFLTAEKYNSKDTMEIHIEFQSTGSIIHAIANVISCEKIRNAPSESSHLLRLVFSHMSELDRNTLIKQLLSRQASDLRSSKHL